MTREKKYELRKGTNKLLTHIFRADKPIMAGLSLTANNKDMKMQRLMDV